MASDKVVMKSKVVLEEYAFKLAGPVSDRITDLLKDAFGDDLWKTFKDRMVMVSDGIFSHFCANACEVQQRIRIDNKTGVVKKGGLFNQENVPADTVLYTVMGERRPGALNALRSKLESEDTAGILQIGGDATVGLGYCTVNLEGENSNEK